MESIVVIVLPRFLTAAFVLLFATASDSAADFAFAVGLAFAFPKPTATSTSPLTATLIFPPALISRGAMPPIKLITMPSTTVAFAKLVNPLFYRGGLCRITLPSDRTRKGRRAHAEDDCLPVRFNARDWWARLL
jgi:hypothetical protein